MKQICVKGNINGWGKYSFIESDKIKQITVKGKKAKIHLQMGANIDKIEVPGNCEWTYYWDNGGQDMKTERLHVKNLVFRSKIAKEKSSKVWAENVQFAKNEKNYIFKDGCIYTKDLQKLVHVTKVLDTLQLPDECEYIDGDAFDICAISKMIISKKFKNVVNGVGKSVDCDVDLSKCSVTGEPLYKLLNLVNRNPKFKKDAENMLKKYPNLFQSKEGYLMTGNVLLNGGAATSENIPENVTIIGTDAMDSFVMEGTKLKRVVCPKGLRAIDAGAFSKSTFEEIVLPDTLEIIDNFAFYGCNNAKICIPKSVKTIGYEAFGRSFGDSDGFLDFSEYTPMKKMEVTFQEVPKNVDAFAVPSNITISFESGFGNAFTAMDVVTKGAKNYSDRLFFAKVKEASGYQIQMKNKKTEKTQTKTIKASDSTKVAQLKVPKKFKYNSTFKIRPYQSKDGKTVYGKWANGRNVPYEED